MDSIPFELEEVSMVDGAGRMQALGHILLRRSAWLGHRGHLYFHHLVATPQIQ